MKEMTDLFAKFNITLPTDRTKAVMAIYNAVATDATKAKDALVLTALIRESDSSGIDVFTTS